MSAPHPSLMLRLHGVGLLKMMTGPGVDLLAQVLWPGRPLPAGNPSPHVVSGSGTRALLAERPILWPALIFTMLLLGATYALAVWGLWALGPLRGAAAAYFLLPAAYLAAISSWSFAYYRFRVPIIPLLAAVAAGALLRDRPGAVK